VANLKSIAHRCHLFDVAFVWELTKETIVLPLGYLQGGTGIWRAFAPRPVALSKSVWSHQFGETRLFFDVVSMHIYPLTRVLVSPLFLGKSSLTLINPGL